jgi:hypothetical protein
MHRADCTFKERTFTSDVPIDLNRQNVTVKTNMAPGITTC